MADENDRPVDEFGEPILTQAEQETERARQEELRRTSEEAAALERQLPSSAQPLSLPVSQGRMYLGPAMTPEQEAAFHVAPSLSSRVLVPPPTAESSAGAAARVAAATAPPTISAAAGAPSPTSIYPEMRQFYAQQQIRNAVAAGMPMDQAVQTYGPEFFARSSGRRYNVHGVGLVDESGKVLASVPKTKTRPIAVAGVGLVDPDSGTIIAAPPRTETVTDVIPASEGTPGSPAIPARSGIFGIGARPAVPAVPATPATPERRITRKVPITEPDGTTKPIPSNKSDLVKGERYTAKGRTWVWDGTKFVAAT